MAEPAGRVERMWGGICQALLCKWPEMDGRLAGRGGARCTPPSARFTPETSAAMGKSPARGRQPVWLAAAGGGADQARAVLAALLALLPPLDW
jgi:hypothetical protein